MSDHEDGYKPTNILVTGGAGFIASHVIILLVNKYPNYKIVNYDVLDYCANLKNVESVKDRENYKFVKGDILSADLVNHVLKTEQIDTILHFAAQSHVDNSFGNSFPFTQTNILGTHVLLESAKVHNICRFVHVSTDEVYGEGHVNDTAMVEESILAPSNPYAASKAAAENILHAYARTYDLQYKIVRMSNNFGCRQYPEKLIPRSILRVLSGKKAQVHGDGSYKRNWLHVKDAARAILCIIKLGGTDEIYNVSGDEEYTNLDVVHKIIALLKAKPDESLEFVTNRPGQDERYAIDDQKIRALGWAPQCDFDAGLAEIVEDTMKNPHW